MSNSILQSVGNLDVVNATLRAPKVEVTTSVGVANTSVTETFSVGDKFHVDKDSTDPVSITGNVVASGIKISNLTIGPAFDFASVSNVGNVTANVIQFANATTGFTTTANVEIGGNITLTSNAQVKVGSNVLAEYTGPHPREPKEIPIKKYPEIVFDASKLDRNDTTNTYTQAGYTVTSSSFYTNQEPYRAFDYSGAGGGVVTWTTDSLTNLYGGVDGLYGTVRTSNLGLDSGGASTPQGGTRQNGEWIKIQMPNKIIVSHISISRVNDDTTASPEDFQLYGSNDGTTWVQILSETGASPSATGTSYTPSSTPVAYKYFGLVVTRTTGRTNYMTINDLVFYGYEEPAPPGDLSLDTTLKSTFNSVRSNNYVMYFDGDGFDPNDTNSNNLVTGSSVSVVHHNATYDSTGKYWTLDGSTESNVTTGSLGFEGDAPHTVSMWVNASNVEDKKLFTIGSGYDKSFLDVDDTQIAANTWHNVTYAYQGEGGSKVTYVDGRKVEEVQVEDTFGEYPPFAMTGYSQGGYVVSASSRYTGNSFWYPYEAFNGSVGGTIGHLTDDNHYTTADPGTYNGTDTNAFLGTRVDTGTDIVEGDWLKIEMPHKLVADYLQIYASTDEPDSFKLYGSNDDSVWTELLSVTGNTTISTYLNYPTTTKGAFKYFALVVSKQGSTQTYWRLDEMKIYGHKEGDLTRFPEPTRVLKYPHIAMTGPAQRGYVASASSKSADVYAPYKAFDNDTSGDNGWTANGTPYSTSDGSYAGGTTYQTTVTGHTPTAVNGEFLQLELTHKIKPTKFRITSYTGDGSTGSGRQPKNGVFAGSNDGTNWVLLKSYTNQTSWTQGTFVEITPDTNTSNYYKYIRLIVTDVQSTTDGTVTIHGLEILGTQEDTGTPTIVGGPFAGKVANFRVYDQYLGDERIQEIYDAQKDEFGHKKSSMTFYKGRIGVGTTEPEGALTVVDEPHALAKFPARAVSADDSYVEGDGQIKLSAADGSGYQAFDGLTSTSWTATPERHTRLSEEVDFGAWLKIQTPESVSLKKAEIESNPDWRQVGSTVNDSAEHAASTSSFGMALDCSDDGTRIIVGAYVADVGGSNRGQAFVFDWNGSGWVRVGNILQGTQDGEYLGYAVAISGDGNYIAVGSPFYDDSSLSDSGRYTVMYLNGSTWTLLPDSGSLTSTLQNYFLGTSDNERTGWSLSLSHDGKTIAAGYRGNVSGAGSDAGQIRVHTYANGAWTQKGQNLNGLESGDRLGGSVKITPDGNHLIAGAYYGSVSAVYVYDYNSTSSQWVKRTTLTHPTSPSTNTHFYGSGIAISDDGNTVAVGASGDDTDGTNYGRVYVYTWSGSAWTLVSTLVSPLQGTDNEYFGTAVDLSGDGTRLVVAAAYENNQQGYAFTYEYTGGMWQLRDHTTSGSAGVSTNGRLGEFYTGLVISRDGSTIVGGDRAGVVAKVRVWNMPSNIKSIWGSNDDVNWTKITTGNETFRVSDRLEFKNLDNPNYYKYHAIVADAFTRLKDVKLFGVRKQGSSTLHDGTLTLTKNLDVPRIGPAFDADDTPRRDRLVVEYNTSTNPVEDGLVQDTSGRGNDGVFYGGASYDATEKALVFDGTDDNIKTTLNNSQMRSLSISGWIKNVDSNTLLELDGGAATSKYVKINIVSGSAPGTGLFIALADGTYLFANGCLTPGVWNHFIFVLNDGPAGSALSSINHQLYINGVIEFGRGGNAFNAGATANDTTVIDPNATLCIGSTEAGSGYHDGSISNFKLYDVALTAEEVKTLYDMGRNGSVANPQPLHIAAPLYAPGTIVQVENTLKLDTFLSAGGQGSVTLQDVPGMSVTIHPKFQNSKFLVSFVANVGTSGHAYLRVKRTQDGVSTEIAQPAASGSRGVGVSYVYYFNPAGLDCYNFEYLDPTPLTSLSPITYQLQGYTFHSTYYFTINRAYSDPNNNYQGHASSTMSVKEICQ